MTTDVKLSARQRQVIEALCELEAEGRHRAFSPNTIAHQAGFKPGQARTARSGSSPTASRQMGAAVFVTTALTGLRTKGLAGFGPRPDGQSGSAYALTAEGRDVGRMLR